MKQLQHFLLMMAGFLCLALSVNAQDFTSGGKYLFKNVESGQFLGAANSWGTQASLLNNSEYVILHENEDGTYMIESQVSNGGTSYYLGSNGWMDSQAYPFAILPSGDYYLMTPDSVSYYGYNGTSVLALDLSADDKSALWQILSVEDILASFANVTPDNPIDATFMILDPNFGRNNRYQDEWQGDGFTVGGNVVNCNAEKWGGNSQTFNIYQDIELPNGLYKVSGQGFYRYNNTTDNTNQIAIDTHADGTEVINAYFYANTDSVALPSIADDAAVTVLGSTPFSQADASNAFTQGLYKCDDIFVQVTDNKLRIGVTKTEHPGCDWTIWDNFTLQYYGNITLEDFLFAEKVQELSTLVSQALDLLANNVLADENYSTEKDALQAAVKNSRDLPAVEEAYDAAIAELQVAIAGAQSAIASNIEYAKTLKKTAFDTLAPVGDDLFMYAPEAIETAKAAIDAAVTIEEIEAVPTPVMTAPNENTPCRLSLTTSEGTFWMNTTDYVKISDVPTLMYFKKHTDSSFALFDGTEYVNYEGSNNWSITTSAYPYGWTIAPIDGGYTITGRNGLLGTNLSDGNGTGSPLYGDKNTNNGNCYWQIIAPKSVFAEEAVFDNWTREFTSDTQNGSFVLNTWSTENDASGVKPPFIETWVWGGSGDRLSNEKIYRTIEDLQPGTYVVNLLLRAYNEMAGSSAPSGVKISANDASVDISEGQEFSYNNMAGIYDNFTIITTVGQDGKLDIAVEVYDANVSWIAFKNLEVLYLGEDILVDSVLEQVGATTVNIASLPNDDYSTKSFSIDMEAIVRALGCTATDIDSIYAYTADGMLSHDYTANPGFWYDQNGCVTSWGNNARVYIEYANLAEGIYNIGQYAGVYSGITKDVDWNAKIILKYGTKYWTVNVNYTVIAASEWENGQDVTDQLGWGATIADEENIEKPYWKGFEYGIDAPYQWEFRDGSGGERDDYHSWAVYNTPTWNVYQEFEIPAGVYTLKVAGAYREGTTNTTFEKWLAGESTKNAFLYAKVGDEVFETPINYFFYGRQTEPLFSYDGWQNDCHFPDKEGVEIYGPSCHWGADKYLENGNWNWNELIFLVPEKTTIRVGIDKRVEQPQDQVWWNDWRIIFEQPYDESALSLVAYNNYLKKENAAAQFAENVISKYPTLGSIMQDEISAFGEDHNLTSGSPLEEIEAAIAEMEKLDANNHAAYTSTQTIDFVIDVCEGILKVTDFSGKADFEAAVNQAKSILYDADNTEATVADYLNASDNLNKARITYLLTQPKNDEGAYDFTHAISNPWFVNQEYTPTYDAAKGVYVFPAEVERTWFGENAPDDETDMERETTDKDGSPLAAVADKAHWSVDETAEEQWVYVDNWDGWHGGMKNCIQKLKGYAAFYSGWAGEPNSNGGMWVTQVLNELPEGYYSLEGYVFAQPENYEEYGNQYMFMNDAEGNELVKVKNETPHGFWDFYQRSEWTQLKSDVFYVPGGKVTVGYHHNSLAGNAGMVLKYYGKEHGIPGDANGDGAVDITDVVCIVNYILGKSSTNFVFEAADVKGDGFVDITDVVCVVNIILGKGNQAKARDMEVLSNALTMLSEKDGINILVEGAAQFAAMQFDVTVPDDATLLDATLNSKSGHQIGWTKIGTNRYRVLAYSLNNANFEPTEDTLMKLVLSDGARASIEKATFVTADGRSIAMNIANEATGIELVDSSQWTVDKGVIYNLAGQRVGTSTQSLPAGIYIRNGKKIKVK